MGGARREWQAALVRNDHLIAEVRDELRLSREERARNREEGTRNREELQAEMQLSREAFEDLRTFTRDLTRRNEVVWRAVLAELEAGRVMLLDMREEIQANTKAVLSVLDRLENGGAAGAS